VSVEIINYRETWQQWLAETEWDYFVTLTFNPANNLSEKNEQLVGRQWSVARAAEDLHHWHGQLDRKMLGNKWHKKICERTKFIAFVEHPDSNIHWHMMLKLNCTRHDTFIANAEAIWTKLVGSGTVDIKPAQSDDTANEIFSRYCGKKIKLSDPVEYIQISKIG